jgi:acyl carrier protein
MDRNEFLLEMDQVLGLPLGTVRGDERLEDLENWDSMSLVTFIALAESNRGARVTPNQVVECATVQDLMRLANPAMSSY